MPFIGGVVLSVFFLSVLSYAYDEDVEVPGGTVMDEAAFRDRGGYARVGSLGGTSVYQGEDLLLLQDTASALRTGVRRPDLGARLAERYAGNLLLRQAAMAVASGTQSSALAEVVEKESQRQGRTG